MQDNCSSDHTIEIIKKFSNLPIKLYSEPDSGLYDGIARGLAKSKGVYHCYINCGDLYDHSFFDTLLRIHRQGGSSWYLGLPAIRDSNYSLIGVRTNFFTNSRLILSGYHNGSCDHYLQQESIFWHSSLTTLLDLERLKTFRLAGDSYLWHSFASHAEPVLLNVSIAAYTHHPKPLSSDKSLYRAEFNLVYPPVSSSRLLLMSFVSRLGPILLRLLLNLFSLLAP